MKRKITAVFLSLALLFAMSAPAFALDRSTFGCWPDLWTWWEGRFDSVRLPAPEITKATYCHKNAAYSGFDNRLQIVWSEVDDAEGYEVEITKADGTVDTYTTTGNCLYIKTDCPKVYVAETHTWTAATVRVRAVTGDETGDWSEAEKISCNAIHG